MLLECQGLTLAYGKTAALQDLTATLEGRIIGVLGANASGKTSLLKVLAGVTAPTSGRVLLDGKELQAGRRPGVSYLPQETGFFPFWQRPGETLSTSLFLAGVKDYNPGELLAAVGLEDEDRSAEEFSGGRRQKLGIAQALVHAPRLLLLDEPTTGLDVRERFRFLRIFERLRSRVTVVFSTHEPRDVAAVCDVALILHRGRAVATGAPPILAARASGHAFEATLPGTQVPHLTRCDIVSVERADGAVRLRVVGERPPGAIEVAPCLEDAYVFLTRTAGP